MFTIFYLVSIFRGNLQPAGVVHITVLLDIIVAILVTIALALL